MVKKLIKHEFASLARLLVPMYIIILGLSVVTRIIHIFENDSTIFGIISGSAVFMLVIGIVVSFAYTFIACIIRFYKNLFSKEGYLTFTLPVSVRAHLLTKLLCASVSVIISVIVIFGAFSIATSGDLLAEIFKASGFILGLAGEYLGAHLGFYIAEFVLLFLVAVVTQFLLYYACMSIGQLARRSRVLLALGVYFGYYYLTQIIVTVLIIISSTLASAGHLGSLVHFVENNPETCIHLYLGGSILLSAVLGFVYYLIAHKIMNKKLNLE